MNPEQKAAVEVAEHLHSIEEFQRDVEPAIIAARNEFLTQETIVGLFANDFIDEIYRLFIIEGVGVVCGVGRVVAG